MFEDRQLDIECADAININQENLKKILNDNRDTAIGKKFHFSEMKTAEEYRRNVPLCDYSDFQEYIEGMREGKENLLTVYPLNGYCITSGTEGKSKYIPITCETLLRYSDYAERYKKWIIGEPGQGKRLFVNTFRTDLDKEQEKGLLVSEVCYRWFYEKGELDMERFAGGKELLFDTRTTDHLYAKVWCGILTEDIVLLESIFQYDILNFFDYFEKHWEEIIRDIENGEIPEDKEISASIRKRLLSFERKPKRLRFVEQECQKGFDGIAKRIWPKLRLLSGISNQAFFAEDLALKRYTGEIPKHYFCYCSSECYIGTPAEENSFDFVLLPNNAFYEFLPYSENDDVTETVLPHECEPDQLYEVIFTNFSGLYRYRMGDVLHMKGFRKESPVFEFAFRRNQALNIAGEKISIRQLEKAVQEMEAASVQVEAYAFGASLEQMPANYIALFVLKENKAISRLADILDAALSNVNRDYMELRSLGQLGKPAVYLADRDEYQEIMESFRAEHRHNKPLHILPEGILGVLSERSVYEAT